MKYFLVLSLILLASIDAKAETAMIWRGYDKEQVIFYDGRDFGGGNTDLNAAMMMDMERKMRTQNYEMERMRDRMQEELENKMQMKDE